MASSSGPNSESRSRSPGAGQLDHSEQHHININISSNGHEVDGGLNDQHMHMFVNDREKGEDKSKNGQGFENASKGIITPYKEKFLALRKQYESVNSTHEDFVKDLEIANARIQKLQAENDLLLDAVGLLMAIDHQQQQQQHLDLHSNQPYPQLHQRLLQEHPRSYDASPYRHGYEYTRAYPNLPSNLYSYSVTSSRSHRTRSHSRSHSHSRPHLPASTNGHAPPASGSAVPLGNGNGSYSHERELDLTSQEPPINGYGNGGARSRV